MLRETKFPENIINHLYKVLEEERDFVGEKPIQKGFIVKRSKDKATITYDDGNYIYAVKLVYNKGEWHVVGYPSMWYNIQELLKMN